MTGDRLPTADDGALLDKLGLTVLAGDEPMGARSVVLEEVQ